MPNDIINYGADFEQPWEADVFVLEHILKAVGDVALCLLFSSDSCFIYRAFRQVEYGDPSEAVVTFIVQNNIDEGKYIITTGWIKAHNYKEFSDYEKIGKKALMRAMNEIWGMKL